MRHVLLLACLLITAVPAFSQRALGQRQQWQPHVTEDGQGPDRRLEQPVEIEILGREAVPSLQILSGHTGVSLGVAPENLDTVGERKLIIIAQGCTLKALMVQMPKALRECHWDIDRSREKPVYLLHRNAGVDALGQEKVDEKRRERDDMVRDWRGARVEAVSHALTLSPSDLAELENADLFLARSMRDPHMRSQGEAFFALHQAHMREFLDAGLTPEIPYEDLDQRIQRAADTAVKREVERLRREVQQFGPGDTLPDAQWTRQCLKELEHLLDDMSDALIYYHDLGARIGSGILLFVAPSQPVVAPEETSAPVFSEVMATATAVAPFYPRPTSRWSALLLRTGTQDKETAWQVLRESWQERDADRESQVWRAVEASALSSMPYRVQLPQVEDSVFSKLEFLRNIASETGLSIISDYYWDQCYHVYDDAMEHEELLWRLLGYLALQNEEATLAGDCLVFHSRYWYHHSRRDAPESLVLAYRQIIEEQGGLTLDDVARLAVELQDLRGTPMYRAGLPADLHEAGASGAAYPHPRWALLLYASLSAEERQKLRNPDGLRVRDLTEKQRQEMTELMVNAYPSVSPEQIYRGTVHLTDSDTTRREEPVAQFEFRVQLPGQLEPAVESAVYLPQRSN